MNNVGVLSWNDSLHKDRHKDLIEVNAQFLDREESPLVELACPNLLDCQPCLVPLILLNAEVEELLLKVFHVDVLLLEFEADNEIFALEEHLIHFLHALDCVYFFN